MAKCSVMLVVLCTLLVLQMVASYPEEAATDVKVALPEAGKAEEKDSSKSDSSSSEEKKDDAPAAPE